MDLSQFKSKPSAKVLGIITFVGEVKSIPTQNGGQFQVQEFGMECFFGTHEKPYIETIAFQATSKPTRKKENDTWVEAPSYLEQFSEKPLKVGEAISVTLSLGGYVKAESGYAIPKITLEYLFRLKQDEATLVKSLLDIVKQAREAAIL